MKKIILLQDLLYESPNELRFNDKYYDWDGTRTRSFIVTKRGIVVSKDRESHDRIGYLARDMVANDELPIVFPFIDVMKSLWRSGLPGRIFFAPKVFTFWEDCPKREFKRIVDELQKLTGLSFWNKGYQIEVGMDKFIPIEKYR